MALAGEVVVFGLVAHALAAGDGMKAFFKGRSLTAFFKR